MKEILQKKPQDCREFAFERMEAQSKTRKQDLKINVGIPPWSGKIPPLFREGGGGGQ